MLTFDDHLRTQLQLLQQLFSDEEREKAQKIKAQQPKQKDEQK